MSRKILFLCHRVPYPPDKGDRIRSYHILQLLRSLGEVTLGYLADGPVSEQTEAWLAEKCRNVVCERVGRYSRWLHAARTMFLGKSLTDGLFYSTRFRRRVDELLQTEEFDSIVCFSSSVVQYVAKRGLDSRTVVDLVDVDSQKWFDYAARSWFPLSWLFRWEAGRVRRIESSVANSKAVVVCTEPEAAVYRSFCPNGNSTVIPNGVDLDYFAPDISTTTADCVFIGYLDYRANVDGLQWFCRNVWPRLREIHPNAVFQVVGRNAVPAVTRLATVPGVDVVGEVADVRKYLHGSRVVVAPLQIARGVQNKVLEAMAAAKPVVATPQALTGIDAVHRLHALSAESIDEWVACITSLWSSEQMANEMGNRARQYVQTHHRWNACLTPFKQLVEESSDQSESNALKQSATLETTSAAGYSSTI